MIRMLVLSVVFFISYWLIFPRISKTVSRKKGFFYGLISVSILGFIGLLSIILKMNI
jgi:uncharacterized membrane protein YobD (UPF0266 family)